MSKILLIYPKDSTTGFLTPIKDILVDIHGENLIILEPLLGGKLSNREVPDMYAKFEDVNTVFFMGHGSRTMLHGGINNEEEEEELFNFKTASRFLHDKNFICLSCWSVHFIYGLKGLRSSIGFGNLPTTWKDITDARSLSKNAYLNYTEKSIDIYRDELVRAFASGLKHCSKFSFSTKDIFLYIRLLINKAISKLVKGDSDEQLAARQLYILKLDMKVIEA